MSLNITLLPNDLTGKALQFFNTAQSDMTRLFSRSKKEFEWLFIDGAVKQSLYAIATDSVTGQIIGINAGIFIPMITPSGESIITIKSEDSLLSFDLMIELGEKEVLNKLLAFLEAKYRSENVSFIWGFTKAKNSFKKCGYTINNHVLGSFYVLKPIQFFKSRIRMNPDQSAIRRLSLIAFTFYNWSKQFLLSGTYFRCNFREISIKEINEEILLSFLPKNFFTIELNKQFLEWRISRNPSDLTYGFLEFRDRMNKVISYLIFSFNKENTFFIEQFLFHDKLTDSNKIQLMKRAFGFIRKKDAVMIRAMGFTDNEQNLKETLLLKKTGFYFFRNKESSCFILKGITKLNINAKDIYLSKLNTLGTV